MQKITTVAELEHVMLQLEHKQISEWHILTEQFHATCESFKPINILKTTIKDAMAAPSLKSDLINAAVGVTTGMIAKKVLVGNTHNPFKKLLGIVVELAVANNVAKNADGIKSMGSLIINKILNRQSDSEKDSGSV